VYTADEQAALTKYQEDWPDIAKGESLLRRAEYKELVAYIFQQVQEYYAPAIEFVQSRTGRDQYTDIVALVPDYDTVRDKALAWIDTQPAYLKDAYTRVANEGSPKDVADMINRFKVETKYVSTTPAASAVVPATPAIPALPAAAVKAAASLAVVNTKRSEQSQGVDENDFEGAFKEYAAKEEQRAVRK
jgi:hypothetical protein